MRTPLDSVALLDAWEGALSAPAVWRAPSLLTSLGWADSAAMRECTVGETDRLLFELRTALLGPRLECVCCCPSCGESVEFAVDADDLAPATGSAGAEVVVELLSNPQKPSRYRVPRNDDLAELAATREPSDARRLLARCLVGDDSVLDAMSDDDCEAALRELAEADPCASIELAVVCTCSHMWSEEFDIRSFLLTELTDWAVRSLRDVHLIASRYGWSEDDILRMSPWRKRIYLEACGGA